jgi:hypothetical protein
VTSLGKTLVLAEKPSVGRELARVLAAAKTKTAIWTGSGMW